MEVGEGRGRRGGETVPFPQTPSIRTQFLQSEWERGRGEKDVCVCVCVCVSQPGNAVHIPPCKFCVCEGGTTVRAAPP